MTTRRQFYQQMYEGLESQGWEKSLAAAGFCAYRSSDGRKCAFGWVIPDDKYDPLFDGQGNNDDIDFPTTVEAIMRTLGMDMADRDFFRAAQIAHDRSIDPEDMKHRFQLLGQFFCVD